MVAKYNKVQQEEPQETPDYRIQAIPTFYILWQQKQRPQEQEGFMLEYFPVFKDRQQSLLSGLHKITKGEKDNI